VLFIGTQFSILYTSMYSPAEAATPKRFFDLEDPVRAKQVDLVFVKFLTYFSAECVLVPPPPCTPGPTADIPSWWSTRRVLKRRLIQKRKRLG